MSFYEHIEHLDDLFLQRKLFNKTKEDLIAIVGQKPTNVSYLKNSNDKPVIVVTYKYNFPPFGRYFTFTFKNDELAKQSSGGLRRR